MSSRPNKEISRECYTLGSLIIPAIQTLIHLIDIHAPHDRDNNRLRPSAEDINCYGYRIAFNISGPANGDINFAALIKLTSELQGIE